MIFLGILHVFVSLVLIFMILLQSGKGGGLSEAFGGASQQIFGTKSSTFLNRATSVCAILFLVTCLSLGILSKQGSRSLMETVSPQSSKPSEVEQLPKSDDATSSKKEEEKGPSSP